MEQVIQFMEVYWGVTLFGGITVGTLITFSVLMARQLIRERTKNVAINSLMDTVANALKAKDEVSYEKAQVIAENQYLKNAMALTFKYMNYLTVASRLEGAQKIELVEEAQALQKDYEAQLKEIAENVYEETKEDIKETLAEKGNPVMNVLVNATEAATSLLDKYSKEEE
jgi:uncharacterized protein YciW